MYIVECFSDPCHSYIAKDYVAQMGGTFHRNNKLEVYLEKICHVGDVCHTNSIGSVFARLKEFMHCIFSNMQKHKTGFLHSL